jgi:hypothetical protein
MEFSFRFKAPIESTGGYLGHQKPVQAIKSGAPDQHRNRKNDHPTEAE